MKLTTCNFKRILPIVGIFTYCLTIFVACSSLNKSGSSQMHEQNEAQSQLKAIELASPTPLKFFKKDENSTSEMDSNSYTRVYEDGQLIRERDEGVEFKVESKFKKRSGTTIEFDYITTEKNGTLDLHDLAYPELNEKIPMTVLDNATVKKAGDFSPTGIFYVPLLSLPEDTLVKGDTWETTANWISSNNGIPLQLNVVSILKDFYRCPNNQTCAAIEISGAVKIPATTKGVQFTSEIRGKMLFSVDRGEVLWSLVRSHEVFISGAQKVDVTSCMLTRLTQPVSDQIKSTKTNCDPKTDSIQLP